MSDAKPPEPGRSGSGSPSGPRHGSALSPSEEEVTGRLEIGPAPLPPEPAQASPQPPPASARSPEGEPLATPGKILAGRYGVLELLGKGGMGRVLAAYDPRLDRRVALKLLLPAYSSLDAEGGSLQVRLLREAQAMARLSHPHVVALYDSGTLEDGSVYLAMECVQGQTLREWLRERPRTWREKLHTCMEAGRGLAAAHAAGLVHRDYKPENVLVGQDGRVRVTDFGLARAETFSTGLSTASSLSSQGEGEQGPASAVPPASDQGVWEGALTLPGKVMGTLRYMAPELLNGQPADARSDLFAFCVVLYEALYEQPAFGEGRGREDRRRAQQEGKVNPPPARSEVPAWVARAVLQGLKADPEQRSASMDKLLAALADDPMARRRGRQRAAAVAGVVLALAGLAVESWRGERGPTCAQLAQERLVGVWDEPRRQGVRQALLGTGLAYAEDTAKRVEAALERYAGQWVQLRAEACEEGQATESPLAVLQVYCLERRRSRLQAYTQLLARGADKELLPRAVEGARALSPLEYCTDEEALTAAVPPPEDPEVRARAEVLQVEVDRLEVLEQAGKNREGRELGEKLLRETEEVGWAPLHARTLYLVGALRTRAGDPTGAEALLRQVIPLAARGGDDQLVAHAWSFFVWSLVEVQARYEEAQGLRLALEAAVARVGDDRTRAQSLNVLANLHWRMGRYEEARARNESALALREKVLGSEHPEVAQSLNHLSLLLRDQGQYEQALALGERALAIYEKVLGREHPSSASVSNNLGHVLRGLGRHEQARARYERAWALWEKALGPEHPTVALARVGLGRTLVRMGQLGEARRYLEHTVAHVEKLLGRAHPQLSGALLGMGELERAEGRPAQAVSWLERALALARSIPRAEVQLELARALWDSGGDRVRARALALEAHVSYQRLGNQPKAAESARWLAEHPQP